MTLLSTPQPARHSSPVVKACRLTHLRFQRPDLERAEAFLQDFGLWTVDKTASALFMRAADSSPYCYRIDRGRKAAFVGFGLEVGSHDDLQRLATLHPGSAIGPADGPGGGAVLRLADPSGFVVEAVHGQAHVAPLEHQRGLLSWNLGEQHPRINGTQRPAALPPDVLKLGHVVLEVADFQATCAWYTRHFGLIPSDVQVLPDGAPAVAFLRLDLGATPADHHTLALAQGFMPTYSHSAFEVLDADAVGMGQRVLRERGWRHAWGMGRHILGSQVFDYWQDPWGDKHEHYCDGDLFTADLRTGVFPVSREAMSQWGPPMPASFTRPSLSPAKIAALLRSLRRSPDVTVARLLQLARLFG